MIAQTAEGFQVRAWHNRKTGTIVPTNWKLQAGTLAGPRVMTRRLENRHKRVAERRKQFAYQQMMAGA